MKLLLVEDNAKMRSTIRKILERNLKDIEQIIECEDGEEAVRLYRNFRPDWVLMDIELEKLDGLTATKMITEMDLTANVLIVTQYDDPSYREAARDAGATDYILKDDLNDILKIIQPLKII